MQDNITNQVDAEIELQYSDSKLTKEIHDYFIGKIAKATGIYESYENKPEKYVHFAKVGEKKKVGIIRHSLMLSLNLLHGVMDYQILHRCIRIKQSKDTISIYISIRTKNPWKRNLKLKVLSGKRLIIKNVTL